MIYHLRKFLRKRPHSFYQDKLISKLNKEHQLLVEIALGIEDAAKKRDSALFKKLLDKFEKELELHLLYEDTNLYEYLNLKYHLFEDIKGSIEAKQKEMKDIAKSVREFIEKYKNSEDFDKFLEEFETIKEILLTRIAFEENVLYDIYNNFYTWKEVLKKIETS